jgi:transcriptional regulator with XRE-family HTH domain
MSASDAPATVGDELSPRMELGWTLEQVAEQVQVSAGILALIETGKRRPHSAPGSSAEASSTAEVTPEPALADPLAVLAPFSVNPERHLL